tara:strand:+ start:2636 stop:3724 length:1089 start_codon:yes stop_codon:yes gene_type:complete
LENNDLIFEKIDNVNYLIYIKKSEKILIVSSINLSIIKNYFSKTKDEFKQVLKKKYKLSDSLSILRELSQLTKKEKTKSTKKESLKNPKFSNNFSFKIENYTYTIFHDDSINMNDIFGQLNHLYTDKKSKDQCFMVFTEKNKVYLYFNYEYVGSWENNQVHFLKGKILSLLIYKYHNLIEKKWSAFLHGSIVHKSNKSFLIIGSSGSGKTSLATLLVKNGFKLICDDTAPLNNEGVFGHFPNALSVKKAQTGILENFSFKDFYQFNTKTYKGEITYLYPKKNKIFKKFYYCNHIFRIKYNKNSNFRISKSKKDEVLQELINDSFLVRNNESVRSFIEWVKKVEFYDIIYSNEKDVLDFIKKI